MNDFIHLFSDTKLNYDCDMNSQALLEKAAEVDLASYVHSELLCRAASLATLVAQLMKYCPGACIKQALLCRGFMWSSFVFIAIYIC